MENKGVASLSVFPYSAKTCQRLPDTTVLKHADAFKINGWKSLNLKQLDDVKSQLYHGHPVIFGMYLSKSFDKLKGQRIYDDIATERVGGHAMVLVGYDERKQAFKLINSWGTGWGDQGYGWVSYQAFQALTPNAYVMQLEQAPKPVPQQDALIDNPPIPKPVPEPKPAPAPKPVPEPKPTPEPVPEPKPDPTPVPKPEPEITPLTHQQIQAWLNNLPCADLNSTLGTDGQVRITGYIGNPDDLTEITQALTQQGLSVKQDSVIRPWPQCEALKTLQADLQTPQGLALTTSADEKGELEQGQKLIIEVKTPAFPSYLYLIYVQANGDAVYLQQPQIPFAKPLNPDTTMRYGDGHDGSAEFTITPPLGPELIVAVASASPLFNEALPQQETEREFLTRFRRAFLVKPDAKAQARIVAAALVTLTTRAKP